MNRESKKFCKDCEMSSIYHIQTWLEELTNQFLPSLSLPRRFELFFDALLEKLFTFFKLTSLRSNFNRTDIQLRTACFIEEASKRGIKFKALRGPFGYTNHFQAEVDGRVFRFESLPIAEFASKHGLQLVDDKEKTKLYLKEGGFPVAEGKSFWFWQKRKAIEFGMNKIGFPLVVKPRNGSLSRHVTTNIQNFHQLKEAVDKAIIYAPAFIIERFIPNIFTHRATVIDFDFVACVKQIPANVVGDGVSTIRKLIDKKNSDLQRGESRQKNYTLFKIVEDRVTEELLSEKGYNFSSISKNNEILYLQRDSFLKLGGDLVEVTSGVHSDNLRLFQKVAKLFDIRVVGIDFLIRDISRSWKIQDCAILELNSLPCIELHHFPSSGKPQNVAKAVVDLLFKYYL